ncbi:hypothetical protein ACLMAL_18875 [Nocardia sp. CWNU-33]
MLPRTYTATWQQNALVFQDQRSPNSAKKPITLSSRFAIGESLR